MPFVMDADAIKVTVTDPGCPIISHGPLSRSPYRSVRRHGHRTVRSDATVIDADIDSYGPAPWLPRRAVHRHGGGAGGLWVPVTLQRASRRRVPQKVKTLSKGQGKYCLGVA